MISGFSVLQVDGYAAYNRLARSVAAQGVTLAACFAHVRRRFYELHVNKSSQLATQAVTVMAGLWGIEPDIRGQDPATRVKVRQEKSARRGAVVGNCSRIRCHDVRRKSWKRSLRIYLMKRDEAISRLQQHEAELKRLGVEHLYMFGSTARGEAGDDSDVDLFFDHEKGKLGLFELMDVKERAANILGRKTDIMTRNSLHPRLRKRIEEAAVLIF